MTTNPTVLMQWRQLTGVLTDPAAFPEAFVRACGRQLAALRQASATTVQVSSALQHQAGVQALESMLHNGFAALPAGTLRLPGAPAMAQALGVVAQQGAAPAAAASGGLPGGKATLVVGALILAGLVVWSVA